MASPLDFRFLDEGLGGLKNKRKRHDEDEEEAEAATREVHALKKIAIPSESGKPIAKPTFDGTIAGRVSGRKWKEPKKTRSSALKVTARRSQKLEELQKLREQRKVYRKRKNELKEEIRANKQEKRRLAEEKKKKKEENELKSGLFQKISNPKTLKKLSKKQRKGLKVIPD
eukprot:TRINITY_DN1082_c0_g2_i1.p1 TRINITY_DN1082_c0_g2~~TRINITY_DN1082_c0_g2_i1.p1  ORF type:complete len:184 (+),score=48.98 TRINITY_DN1082_c0_g2_i1:42-554(+)